MLWNRPPGAAALFGAGVPACALLVAGLACAPASAATLSGFVRAADNGEALPYANVQVASLKRGAQTNQSGYYVLTGLPEGPLTVTLSCLGYRAESRAVTLTEGRPVTVTVELATAPHEIATTEVVPTRLETGIEPGKLRLETSQLRQMPVVGEADLFRAVQALPGVSTLSDFSAGLYVRGGSADQNLILLDDIDVYNPSHLFGFFSTFNVDAVKNVDLQKSGYPAQYGGRLSSLLDVHNRDGNRKRFQGVARTGLIASSATLEGPWKHGSWMVSGRQTHLEALAKAMKFDLPYQFYDVQTRFNWDVTANDRASVSYYSGRDELNWDEPGFNLGLDWGNRTWGAQWTHVFNSRLFSHTVLGHSRFDSNSDFVLQDIGFHSTNSVEDLALRQNVSWAPSAAHKLDAGLEAKRLKFGFRSAFGNAEPLEFPYRGTYGSAYVQDAWRVSDDWRVQTGLRLDHYSKGDWWRVDPRLSAERTVNERLRVHAAYGRYHQFLNLVSVEGMSFADMWFPVDETLAPGRADHWIAGADFGPFRHGELGVELYYKPYANVVEFSEEFTRSIVPSDARMSDLFRSGHGRSWGGEVFLRNDWRGWQGWSGYSYGDAKRTIRGYNFGNTYRPTYDRRHQWVMSQSRALGKHWGTSFTFRYGTGQPLTLPAGRYTVLDVNGHEYDVVLEGPKGGSRLPDYHRLDASISSRFHIRKWKVEPTLQIVNVYNHKNVYVRSWDTSQNPARVHDVHQLPFLPTLDVKVEF